jgi:hypothetical protein
VIKKMCRTPRQNSCPSDGSGHSLRPRLCRNRTLGLCQDHDNLDVAIQGHGPSGVLAVWMWKNVGQEDSPSQAIWWWRWVGSSFPKGHGLAASIPMTFWPQGMCNPDFILIGDPQSDFCSHTPPCDPRPGSRDMHLRPENKVKTYFRTLHELWI